MAISAVGTPRVSFSTGPITVIVPCRNAERTIGEAIESALAQTVAPQEILVIDDASTDRTRNVAQLFGSIVRVLANPQRGPGAARRLGVEQAKGLYIAYVDADDRIEPTKHERQIDILEQSDPYTAVHTDSYCFTEDGDMPDSGLNGVEQAVGECTRLLFECNPVCGASTMYRRSVLRELGNYDADMLGAEDYLMSLQASTRCTFALVHEPLYARRRHLNNITGRRSLMAYYHWLAQDRFRRRYPEVFAALPDEVVRRAMIEPVLRATREAYWHRQPDHYRKLLSLSKRIAPNDPTINRLWRRRWCPLNWLRIWDRLNSERLTPAGEVG